MPTCKYNISYYILSRNKHSFFPQQLNFLFPCATMGQYFLAWKSHHFFFGIFSSYYIYTVKRTPLLCRRIIQVQHTNSRVTQSKCRWILLKFCTCIITKHQRTEQVRTTDTLNLLFYCTHYDSVHSVLQIDQCFSSDFKYTYMVHVDTHTQLMDLNAWDHMCALFYLIHFHKQKKNSSHIQPKNVHFLDCCGHKRGSTPFILKFN